MIFFNPSNRSKLFFSTNTTINSTLKHIKNYNYYLEIGNKRLYKKFRMLKLNRFYRKKKYYPRYKDIIIGNKRKSKKKKKSKYLVYIESNHHNIQIFVYNKFGDCLFWINGGSAGYKGRKKAAPFVGRVISDLIIKKFKYLNPVRSFSFFFKGFGPARRSAIQRFRRRFLHITQIHKLSDITPIPHNGCRRKKKNENNFNNYYV